MAAIARFVLAHKRLVALFWVVLTVVGIATVNSATKAMDQSAPNSCSADKIQTEALPPFGRS